MKKVISVATTAAMTLSMISVPVSLVSAAESSATDAFSIVLKDQTVVRGLTSAKIPVSFDSDVSLTSASFKFSTRMYPDGIYSAKITKAESALSDDSGVTVSNGELNTGTVNITSSTGKDVQFKKGETVFYLDVELVDDKGAPASAIPNNALFRVELNDFDVVDENKVSYSLSSDKMKDAGSYLFVRTVEETSDLNIKLESKSTTEKTVSVPVHLKGSVGVFRTEFRVNNGAKITGVTVNEKDEKGHFSNYLEEGKNGTGLSFAYMELDAEKNPIDCEFDDDIATVNVKLPDDVADGDTFDLIVRYFDANNIKDDSLYPASIINSKITYGEKTSTGGYNVEKPADDNWTKTIVPSNYKADFYATCDSKFANPGFGSDFEGTITVTNTDSGVKTEVKVKKSDFKFASDADPEKIYNGSQFLYTVPATLDVAGVDAADDVKAALADENITIDLPCFIGMLGDVSLDHKVAQADATYLVRDILAVDGGHASIVKKDVLDKETDAAVKARKELGDRVYDFSKFLSDTNLNKSYETKKSGYEQADATIIVRAILKTNEKVGRRDDVPKAVWEELNIFKN